MNEGTAYTREDLAKLGAKWLDRIAAAEKRCDGWIKDAEKAESTYLCGTDVVGPNGERVEKIDAPDFNILHSNVETIVPSIYNSTPVPDIRPRHGADDGAARLAGQILEAAIAVQIDDNRLDAEIEALAQDAFMAGRGVVRIKLDADTMEVPEPDEAADLFGEMAPPAVANERIMFECVSWKDYREGPASRWRDVPWVAYRHHLCIEDVEKLTDEALRALQIDKRRDATAVEEKDADAPIWEIWCKDDRRVYFIAADTQRVLRIADDPLGLPGFFPQAEPVQPITATGSRIPVCPYSVYRTLADELDMATQRINAIMEGLRVRGIIAGDATTLEKLSELKDNELMPLANLEGLVAAGGLQNAVMWWPVEQAIKVLQQLYVQREQTKQAIYEITGISDIIRGQSAASETATAQQIKTEWGALRIKKMQRLIERQVRDIFVICADIIGRHFSRESLQMMTGIAVTPEADAILGDPLANYRINVESDSTVRADTSRHRKEMSEFLAGTGQYFATMAPIVQQSPEAVQPVAEIYAAFARQFNLGKSASDALDQLVESARQLAQNPPPNPQAEAAQAEMQAKQQAAQADAAAKQAEIKIKQQQLQADVMHKAAQMQLEQQKLEMQRNQYAAENRVRDAAAIGTLTDGTNALNELLTQALAAVIGEIRAGDARLTEALTALAAGVAQGNAQIVAAMTAPKELLRDESGRPIGVRTVAGDQRVMN